MKYKNRLKYLQGKQAWFDKLDQKTKDSMTRPGSIKTK